jgi:hypothetical protein
MHRPRRFRDLALGSWRTRLLAAAPVRVMFAAVPVRVMLAAGRGVTVARVAV